VKTFDSKKSDRYPLLESSPYRPCVEVIKSQFGSDEVFHTVVELMKRVGKEPVRVLKDIPGFLGNRLQHALWREAISLVEKGIAALRTLTEL